MLQQVKEFSKNTSKVRTAYINSTKYLWIPIRWYIMATSSKFKSINNVLKLNSTTHSACLFSRTSNASSSLGRGVGPANGMVCVEDAGWITAAKPCWQHCSRTSSEKRGPSMIVPTLSSGSSFIFEVRIPTDVHVYNVIRQSQSKRASEDSLPRLSIVGVFDWRLSPSSLYVA